MLQDPRHWVAMFGFPHPLVTNMAHITGPAASTQVGDPVGDVVGAEVAGVGSEVDGGVVGAGVLGASVAGHKPHRALQLSPAFLSVGRRERGRGGGMG